MEQPILVIDDEEDIVELVSNRLEANGYKVVSAGNGREGLDVLSSTDVGLIILDVTMPEMDGYQFIQEFQKDDKNKDIPVIVLTAKKGYQEIFQIEGVHHYLEKPFQSERLLDLMSNVLKEKKKKKILVVDDDPDIVELLENRLLSKGYDVVTSYDGPSCIEMMDKHLPDLIILDIMMPGLDGTAVCSTLKTEVKYQTTPIIIISAKDLSEKEARDIHANAFVKKPFDPENLLKKIKEEIFI